MGAERLAGKVVLDLANPLDFSAGFPPTLAVKDTDSLAEQIQRAFPEARVVKALNTVNASVMVDPSRVGDGGTTMFAASDDAEARAVVVGLLQQIGWRDVIEFDQLSAARGMEMWLPMWVRLMGTLGTADFNIAWFADRELVTPCTSAASGSRPSRAPATSTWTSVDLRLDGPRRAIGSSASSSRSGLACCAPSRTRRCSARSHPGVTGC